MTNHTVAYSPAKSALAARGVSVDGMGKWANQQHLADTPTFKGTCSTERAAQTARIANFVANFIIIPPEGRSKMFWLEDTLSRALGENAHKIVTLTFFINSAGHNSLHSCSDSP